MRREKIVGFVSVVLFLFSMFPISVYRRAADSHGSSSVSTAQLTTDPLDWWPMFHHDLAHSGYSTSTAPTTNQTLWTYTTGGRVSSSPAVVNGVVYVGGDDDNVYALDATTGALVWKYTTGGPVASSPAVVNGVVYVGSDDDNVYALNAATGALVWKYTTGGYLDGSSPAVAGGVVYVGSVDDNVYALNAATGASVWKYVTGGYVYSSPAVANGIVYIGSNGGNVYAFGSPQTVYINADGSITPAGAPIVTSDNITYNLTGNISYPAYYGIVVERSNIIIDGKGYTVQGNQSGYGIYLVYINNVTIKNTNVKNFQHGIFLLSSSNNTVNGNNVTACSRYGIVVQGSSNNNTVSRNTVTANGWGGIFLVYSSDNNTVSGNNASANSADGIDIYYSSNNNTVSGNTATANSGSGIFLYSSSNNTVSGNNASANSADGIDIYYSSNNNTVSGNNASANTFDGIYIYYSSNNNIVSGNTATANKEFGIWLTTSCSNNSISGNSITNDGTGIEVDSSSSNEIYHNNFINNSVQVYSYNSTNTWDNGYPCGGNYWSDYSGNDSYSGPYQNVTGSDGIGDTPYVINEVNIDHYPLMQPWTGPLPTSTFINLSVSLVKVSTLVTCTATVSGVNAGTRASGTVTWSTSSSTGNFSQSVCTLSAGSCSTTYVDGSPGSVTIAACYSGDSNYQPSNGSTTLTVVSSGPVYYSVNYATVQAAINAATSGSNVIVAAGTYNGYLILNKTLTIIGERDQPVFGGGGSGVYLTVLSGAPGAIVTGFDITSYDEGILVYATNCKIYGNSMSSMGEEGIVLEGSSATGDVIYDNAFQDTPTPISLTTSAAGNTIYGNIINSQAAVTLNIGANDNSVYQNVISGSSIVLNMTNSLNNVLYHNDFLATVQIVASGANTWDNGYPSGGNYWSDYQTKYPGATENDSSGIWNTAYVINSGNKDNYPLMKPYAPAVGHDVAVTSVVLAKSVITKGLTCNVTVNVFNEGQYTETFSVTLYANTTVIGTQQVNNLASTGQTTLTFTWDTTGFAQGTYTISAYATPVSGETNIADNTFVAGTVQIITTGGGGGRVPYMD